MPNFMPSEDQVPQESDVPAWMLASDNHNLGNTRGGSLLDPTTWPDRFENGGKLLATGFLSGLNSFYNTGASVGRLFGSDIEDNNTAAWISEIDSDLGVYYSQNRTAADLVGFVAGSLLPGIGGVKILNAGQEALRASKLGFVGKNMEIATGLLAPTTDAYIVKSAKDIAGASATFSTLNANTAKALAAGVWQNVLEGAAFETAVQATMFKSPILQEQDGWDIAKNIATGAMFQGVVGGAFQAASSLGLIQKGVQKIEQFIKPFSSREAVQEGLTPAEKLIILTDDKFNAVPPVPGSENFEVAMRAYNDRLARSTNAIRAATHKLVAGTDSELGNMMADAMHGQSSQDAVNNLLNVDQVSRLSVTTKIEKRISELAKENTRDPNLVINYVKLTGEDAGIVTDKAPLVTNLADTLVAKSGMDMRKEVIDLARQEGFKLGLPWNVKDMTMDTGHFRAEKRYLWANEILKEIPDGTLVHQFDIPVLERALKDGQTNIKLVNSSGKIVKDSFTSPLELRAHLRRVQNEAAQDLITRLVWKSAGKDFEPSMEAVAKIVNVKRSRLEGKVLGDSDFEAWQSGVDDYKKFLESKGLKVPANDSADPRFLPSHAKVTRDIKFNNVDGNVVDAMTYIKSQEKVFQASMDNVVAKAAGDLHAQLPEITDSDLMLTDRYGAGAGLFKNASGGYGGRSAVESKFQQIGSIASKLGKQLDETTSEALQAPLHALGNSQEAAVEFSTINQKVSRSGTQWVRHSEPLEEGSEEYLITQRAKKKYSDKDTGELDWDSLNAEAPEEIIRLHKKETIDAVDAHIGQADVKQTTWKELRAAQGKEDAKSLGVFRPIRPSLQDYPYFALVKDPRVTGTGHTTMIHAASEAKLAQMVNKVQADFPEYQVLTKGETEDYFKARNEYEYERSLHESYIDSDLASKGIMSDFLTTTDPQKVVNDLLRQHLRENSVLTRELIRGKYQKQFDYLEDQAKAYSKFSSSKFGNVSARLEQAGINPYLDYMKTALNISKASEYQNLFSANKALDSAFSRATERIGEIFNDWKAPMDDQKVLEINKAIDRFGMGVGYRDAAMELLANHTAPRGELTKFVRAANAVLSKLTLGLDPLNALNNAIGATILRGTELKQLTDAIEAGNTDLAGKLTQLKGVKLPTGDYITSPSKIIASAISNFTKDDGTLMARYREAGLVKDATQQFKDILEDFTLKGTETVGELAARRTRAFQAAKAITEKGEKLTGNKFAEDFNRFISADVIRQLTDPAVAQGILTKGEQAAYMNSFVNRVEGVTIASQRPLVFQGPVGQAVGLFQSYQFNLMQQMFRYVAEGTKKDAAMLMGLQSTMYGVQGLPAFQFINQHIVGTASGNKSHTDLYDATYGVAGRELGDLVMYGIPSNIVHANIYSRGDVNPRQLTILPTTLPEIPFVGAFGKFLGSIKDTVSKISQGGNVWESMLQGLEHNGLNRPLQGIAQTLQATTGNNVPFSTSSKGTILASNDLFSWATAVRLAGGRPIDEAIVNDGVFRNQAYKSYDLERMKSLSEAVKTTAIMGQSADSDSINKFAERYAAIGGRQKNFNQWMMNQYSQANTSESQKIQASLTNPFAYKMQLLMQGPSLSNLSEGE